MTILAVALGRYPFVTPNAARSGGQSGEVITEGDGGYWAILQAIQERPSIRSLLSSCQHHCSDHHSHSPRGFQGTDSTSPTAHSTASPPHFSKAFHSFLSQCLQKDPKQRPSAQTLLQHPFFQIHPVTPTSVSVGDTFALTPASHLADDFIRHCCARHKENLEAKAIVARNRLSQNSLFFNISEKELDPVARVSAAATPGSVAPRSGEKTADNNANRRRIRKSSVTEPLTDASSRVETEEVQDEGIRQLRTVIKAYREYLNRTWGKKIKSGMGQLPRTGSSPLDLDIASSQVEKVILATITPLHSRAVLFHISVALNVPLPLVNKSFQKIIRELKDYLASTSAGVTSTDRNFHDKSLTALLERGFPSSDPPGTRTPPPGMDCGPHVNLRRSKDSSSQPLQNPEASCPQEVDPMDRSDGSETAAVAELRDLMNTRSSPTAAVGTFQTSAEEMLQQIQREDVVTEDDYDEDKGDVHSQGCHPEELWSERRSPQGEGERNSSFESDLEEDMILPSALPLSPLNHCSLSPEHRVNDDREEDQREREEEDYDDDFEEEHE